LQTVASGGSLMKLRLGSAIVALGAFAAISIVSTGAHAQQQGGVMTPGVPGPLPTAPYRPPVGEQKTEFVKPNVPLLGTGILTLAASYVPSFVVAATSDHDGDKWLYAPVIGPFMDLITRKCDNDVQTATCGTTSWERGALISSGVVQAIGGAMIVGSFFVPTRKVVTTTGAVDSPRLLQITPVTLDAHTPGLMAIGTF